MSLVVSGVAITQILPGHFAEQTQERIQTAAGSTGILLRDEITRVGEIREASVVADETRNTFLVRRSPRPRRASSTRPSPSSTRRAAP